jgi:hypothetical protein
MTPCSSSCSRGPLDRGQQTQLAHVIEARVLGGGRLDLSLRFDPALRVPSKVVAEARLNVISLGPPAFADLAVLQTTVAASIPAILGSVGKAAPSLLTGDALKSAVLNNQQVLLDFVTGAIVSDAIGGDNNDPASEGFAQRLADFQARRKLRASGQLNEPTMREIVEQLRAKGHFNSILRLVIDYGRLERNVVVDARYNAEATDEFWIDRRPGGTSAGSGAHDAVTVDFGPKAFPGPAPPAPEAARRRRRRRGALQGTGGARRARAAPVDVRPEGHAAVRSAWLTPSSVRWRIGWTNREAVPDGLEHEGQLCRDLFVRVDVPVQPVVRPWRHVRLLPCDARLPRARGRGRRVRRCGAERRGDHRHPEGDDRRELAARDVHRRAGQR